MYSDATVLHILLFVGTASALCQINLDTPLGSMTPIILKNSRALEPATRSGDYTFQDGDEMQFLCSGPNNYLINPTIRQLSNATCRTNRFTLDNGQTYTFAQLRCRQPPQPDAKEVGTCNLNSKKIHIGFQVTPQYFYANIELCFDATELITYWSKNIVKKSPYSCPTGVQIPFKKDFFGNVNPDAIYSGSSYDKGHLSARCDFFSGPEKRMTFYYINSAPQVISFNRVNWRDLEGVIRTTANQHQRTFYVYTGTTGSVQKLSWTIPIPQYFWKVVIDSGSGDGVAFVGVNNVQQGLPNPCPGPSICRSLSWLGANFIERMSRTDKGKIYCCPVPMLRNTQNIEIPDFAEFRGGLLRFR